ncbi:hypothetical protein [Paraburkholderia sp. SIMBA_054]|uniref:hypothetical protein n=1 Tax=Paraburkholderia sp. SIMBA_054 TaxID=3085795 RepID=UPI0039795FBF
MKNLIALTLSVAALAVLQSAAIAAQTAAAKADVLVLKDSRVFKTYTTALTDDGTCHMPANPDQLKPDDCAVTRQSSVIGGELLTWNDGQCTDDSWSLIDERKFDAGAEGRGMALVLPTINVAHRQYACDALGGARSAG